MKVNFILRFILAAICFQLISCGYPETPMVKLKGPNDNVELVFFFKKDTSNEGKRVFLENGRGLSSQEGISGMFLVRNSGYEGHAIEFFPNATIEQRENVKKLIKESPIIYKIYENVVPNQIKDL